MKGGGDKEVEEFSNAIADYQQVLFIQEEFNNRDIGNLKFNKPFFKSVIENVKKNYLQMTLILHIINIALTLMIKLHKKKF